MRTSVLQGRPKVPASAVTEQRRLPWQICITVSVAYETRQAAKGMLSVRVVDSTTTTLCGTYLACHSPRDWSTHCPGRRRLGHHIGHSPARCGQRRRCRWRCGSRDCTSVACCRSRRPPCCGIRLSKSSSNGGGWNMQKMMEKHLLRVRPKMSAWKYLLIAVIGILQGHNGQ